jgi:hypothetical protein
VLAIWGAACGVAISIVFASYFFHPALFWQGMRHARWLDFDPRALAASVAYRHSLQTISLGSPPMTLVLPVALATFAVWKRTRYFGNFAPLGIAVALLVLGMGTASFPGEGFHLTALVFLFVFVAGVFADLMETRHRLIVMAALIGLLTASAVWNLVALGRAARL